MPRWAGVEARLLLRCWQSRCQQPDGPPLLPEKSEVMGGRRPACSSVIGKDVANNQAGLPYLRNLIVVAVAARRAGEVIRLLLRRGEPCPG